MGRVTLNPGSEYMKAVADVQRMKGLLGAENFTAWRSACSGAETGEQGVVHAFLEGAKGKVRGLAKK